MIIITRGRICAISLKAREESYESFVPVQNHHKGKNKPRMLMRRMMKNEGMHIRGNFD